MIRSNQSGTRQEVDRSTLRSRPHRASQAYCYMGNTEQPQWSTSATKYRSYKEQKEQISMAPPKNVEQSQVAVSDFNKVNEPLRERSYNLPNQEFTLKRQYDSDNIPMPLRLSYQKPQTPSIQQRRHSTFLNSMRTEREEENPTNTTPEQFTINRKNPSPMTFI